MRPHGVKLQEQLWVEAHASIGINIDLRQPAANTVRVELLIPSAVERIGQVNAFSVPADLDHLWSAVQWRAGMISVRFTTHDAAQLYRAGPHRLERIRHVILQQLSRAPTRDIQKAIIMREVNVCDQRRHRFESLEKRWQLIGVRRLGWTVDHFPSFPRTAALRDFVVPNRYRGSHRRGTADRDLPPSGPGFKTSRDP